MRKLLTLTILAAVALGACQRESIDDRAEREAREYTAKYCPTPEIDNSRLDSVVFDRETRTFIYYHLLMGLADNEAVVKAHEKQWMENLTNQWRNNPQIKPYRDKKIAYRYVYRSQADPKKIWIDVRLK